ncbi:unnamed protein product, partial [Adineta steineri]
MAHLRLKRPPKPSKLGFSLLVLQQAVGAPKGCIAVTGIGSAVANSAKGRRRRDVQCDKTDTPGVAIIFDVLLDYPQNLACQSLTCQVELFNNLHEKFNSVTDVTITSDDGTPLPVQLCHIESHTDGTNSNAQGSSGVVLPVCTGGCQNGGTCTAPDTCICATGWSGASCTI